MDSLKTILEAVDPVAGPAGAGSRAALSQAVRLGAFSRASVRAVHVVDTGIGAEFSEAAAQMQLRIRDNLIQEAMDAYRAWASATPDASGVPLDVHVCSRVEGILSAAEKIRPDLIVIGAQSTPRPDVGLGTIATSCVRHARCPVLAVRDDHPGPFHTVVACVDFSPASDAALLAAARLAAQDQSALHVLHAVESPSGVLSAGLGALILDAAFKDKHVQLVRDKLAALVDRLGPSVAYLKPTLAVHDQPGAGYRSAIAEYASKVGADLIVLGTRGRGSTGRLGADLRDLLLGTTAEKTLRDSRCSVLAVR
jgi:nucleotide-binding universal stress UspA family protein